MLRMGEGHLRLLRLALGLGLPPGLLGLSLPLGLSCLPLALGLCLGSPLGLGCPPLLLGSCCRSCCRLEHLCRPTFESTSAFLRSMASCNGVLPPLFLASMSALWSSSTRTASV
eukprot:Tamp_30338.p2 GENE.Tamp_30338~~Tamp_30338.p2  ORF type:complete len:114 (+),score=3.13 Tamp_30338:334-675(+)